jgi:hypothetical protein
VFERSSRKPGHGRRFGEGESAPGLEHDGLAFLLGQVLERGLDLSAELGELHDFERISVEALKRDSKALAGRPRDRSSLDGLIPDGREEV